MNADGRQQPHAPGPACRFAGPWRLRSAILATTLLIAGIASAQTSQPASQPDSAGLVPVEIKLPKPAFASTPKNVPPGTTVEKPTGKPRPAFLAPPGVRNFALGGPVTSSETDPIVGTLKLLTDGNKEAADGSFVELGPGLQHVQIDLGQPVEIWAIIVWHYHGDPRVYRDVIVRVADDADFKTNVRTLFNNDQDNSAGLGAGTGREFFETHEGRLIPGGRAVARYVRLYSKGSTAGDTNHYSEVEVYGLPGK